MATLCAGRSLRGLDRRRDRACLLAAMRGSKAFVQEIGGDFFGPARAKNKRLAHGPDSTGAILHSYRLLSIC